MVGQTRDNDIPAARALLQFDRAGFIKNWCSPTSPLVPETDRNFGEENGFHRKSWNGYDLATEEGTRKARHEFGRESARLNLEGAGRLLPAIPRQGKVQKDQKPAPNMFFR